MKTAAIVTIIVAVAAVVAAQTAASDKPGPTAANPYAAWQRGLPKGKDFFPIAVWLQSPANAAKYKAAGINVYVALWQGPTAEQLEQLRAAKMPVICDQNEYALANCLDDPIIVGWMHGDEPDNAQSDGRGGYGPPVKPVKIIEDYHKIKAKDPTRPVMLNLGQGVAWDNWNGRGVRTRHPEDYAKYVKGSDIVSFDIYPAVHRNREVAGNLWYVPYGVERLVKWTDGKKIVWNCIEASRISNPSVVPTGHQIRSEVWMSIIHGSEGLIYFVHQFKPQFNEDSLLDNPKLLAQVTAINKQVHALAPVINSPNVEGVATVVSANEEVPVRIMTKRHEGAAYIFAAAMREGKTNATFQVDGLAAGTVIEVIGEDRTVTASKGQFADDFGGYDVHLYKMAR